ncbi:MAG: pyridoxal phosphate-dependent aminotransferase, partial [Bdellovibrionaceae bacterium]|nr:pyridoxal phosphate-dependent aminotransferase [Pseudobdellovibrionaceae bacterium]
MLSKRAQLLKPSPILMLAAKAAEMKASGLDVISLTIGEPDWETFDSIREAAITAIRNGQTKYTPPAGIPELRKAVAAQLTTDLRIPVEPADVTVSSGAKFVLFSALQVITDPGDEVILVAPFWASYTSMVELAEGTPKIVVTDEKSNFKLTPELLRRALTPKTKALLLNSPSNPTGMIYTPEELKALAAVLKDHPRVVVISDDIYNRLVFSSKGEVAPHLLHVAPELRDRVIALNGASKSYAMTGWRIGWASGPREIITAMSNYQSQSVSCASAISQRAALEGVLHAEADVAKTRQLLVQRYEFIRGELEKIPLLKVCEPQGAFYIWLDVSKYLGRSSKSGVMKTTMEMAQALLNEQHVAVVPGAEFGLDGYFRLSFALENTKAK